MQKKENVIKETKRVIEKTKQKTIISEEEKAGLVNTHRDRFEPENNSEDMKTLVIDDEDIKTEPLINCKFCEKTFCARVDLKNHMLNDHAKASTDSETNSTKVVSTLAQIC